MKNRPSVSFLPSTAPRISPGIRRRPLICAASIALVAAAVSHSVHAATGTWTSLTSGLLWSDTTAWSGGIVADGTDSSALFNTLDLTAATTVQLDTARTVGSLLFADVDPNTPASWTLGNNGNPANILTMAGTAPTINVTSMGTGSTLTLGTALAGVNGLTFSGTGTVQMAGTLLNTYTGGTVLRNRVEVTSYSTAPFATFGSAVATNTLTFDGGYFKMFETSSHTQQGALVNNIVVNTTGTLEYGGRVTTTGTLTGSGVFNVLTHYVRSDNGGNWSAFTGTINVTSGEAGITDFRQTTYNGFAGATLNLGVNSNVYISGPNQTNTTNPLTGTQLAIGALSGDASAILRGGPVNGRVTSFRIGAKNIDTVYAGQIEADAAVDRLSNIVKSGTGKLTLTGGTSAYTGPTYVSAGTLAVAVLNNGGAVSGIGRSSNAATNLVLDGGTFQYIGTGHSTNRLMTIGITSPVTIDASGSGAVNFTNTGAIVLSGATARTITFAGSNISDNTFSPILSDNGTTAVTKSGASTWLLAGGNSYTGVTTVGGGVLSSPL